LPVWRRREPFPSGCGDPQRAIRVSSRGGPARRGEAVLVVEAAEQGGVVFFLAGDGSDVAASTGWLSWVEGLDAEGAASG
jgi:hypothetical protein